MEITSFSQLDLQQQYTYADYLLWKFNERIELLRGYVLQMAAPNRKHQTISFELGLLFGNFFRKHPCKVYVAPFDVRLPKNNATTIASTKDIYTVVQPDLCVVCDLAKLDDVGCLGSPDLIVEILSPSNTKKDTADKFKIYEEHGVKEYWIANPMGNYIQQFVLNQNQKYEQLCAAGEGETLTVFLFPDLTIAIDEVFAD